MFHVLTKRHAASKYLFLIPFMAVFWEGFVRTLFATEKAHLPTEYVTISQRPKFVNLQDTSVIIAVPP